MRFMPIALIAAAGIAAVLLYATTRPDEMLIERSVRIAATPAAIHPLINDMRQFNTWNPFNKKDPSMKGSYRGPQAGPGAAFDFDGGSQVGTGSVTIVEPSAPGNVSMRLDMTKPMQANNQIDFRLVPQGANETQVTWAMRCQSPYLGKLMGIFINMDKMIGGDFERGLASLKALAEKR